MINIYSRVLIINICLIIIISINVTFLLIFNYLTSLIRIISYSKSFFSSHIFTILTIVINYLSFSSNLSSIHYISLSQPTNLHYLLYNHIFMPYFYSSLEQYTTQENSVSFLYDFSNGQSKIDSMPAFEQLTHFSYKSIGHSIIDMLNVITFFLTLHSLIPISLKVDQILPYNFYIKFKVPGQQFLSEKFIFNE